MVPPPRWEDSDSSSDDDSDTESEYEYVKKSKILPMDSAAAMAIQDAVQNLLVCHELFKSWKTELEKTSRRSSNVSNLAESVEALLEQSAGALDAAEDVITGHCRFSKIFYRALRQSAKTGRLEYSKELEKAAANIEKSANVVSRTIARMRDDLEEMADNLQSIVDEETKKPRSLKEKVKGWIRDALRAVAAVLNLGAVFANVLMQPHYGAALALGSSLCKKLDSILGSTDSMKKKRNITDTEWEKLFLFLKTTLRDEVSKAKDTLVELESCQDVLNREFKKNSDRIFLIRKTEAEELYEKWRRRNRQLEKIEVYR